LFTGSPPGIELLSVAGGHLFGHPAMLTVTTDFRGKAFTLAK
jgi:hypothetical protein